MAARVWADVTEPEEDPLHENLLAAVDDAFDDHAYLDNSDPLSLTYVSATGAESSSPTPTAQLIDPLSEAFDPSEYLRQCRADSSLAELKRGLENLERGMERRTTQLKALVKSKFDKFVQCKDMVHVVGSKLNNRDMIVQPMKECDELCEDAHAKAVATFEPLILRRQEVDGLRNALSLLRRFRFILDLPHQITTHIAEGKFDQVVREHRRAKELKSIVEKLPLFSRVLLDVEHRVSACRYQLQQRLEDVTVPFDDQLRAISVLRDLDTSGDPVQSFMRHRAEGLGSTLGAFTEWLVERLTPQLRSLEHVRSVMESYARRRADGEVELPSAEREQCAQIQESCAGSVLQFVKKSVQFTTKTVMRLLEVMNAFVPDSAPEGLAQLEWVRQSLAMCAERVSAAVLAAAAPASGSADGAGSAQGGTSGRERSPSATSEASSSDGSSRVTGSQRASRSSREGTIGGDSASASAGASARASLALRVAPGMVSWCDAEIATSKLQKMAVHLRDLVVTLADHSVPQSCLEPIVEVVRQLCRAAIHSIRSVLCEGVSKLVASNVRDVVRQRSDAALVLAGKVSQLSSLLVDTVSRAFESMVSVAQQSPGIDSDLLDCCRVAMEHACDLLHRAAFPGDGLWLSSSERDVRLLLGMSGAQALHRALSGPLKSVIASGLADAPLVDKWLAQVLRMLGALRELVVQEFVRVHSVEITGLINKAMLCEGYDYGDAQPPREVRAYVLDVLLVLVRVFGLLHEWCPDLLPECLSRMIGNMLRVWVDCIAQTDTLSTNAGLQLLVELTFLERALGEELLQKSRNTGFDSLRAALTTASGLDRRDEGRTVLTSQKRLMQEILDVTDKRTALLFHCFRQAADRERA